MGDIYEHLLTINGVVDDDQLKIKVRLLSKRSTPLAVSDLALLLADRSFIDITRTYPCDMIFGQNNNGLFTINGNLKVSFGAALSNSTGSRTMNYAGHSFPYFTIDPAIVSSFQNITAPVADGVGCGDIGGRAKGNTSFTYQQRYTNRGYINYVSAGTLANDIGIYTTDSENIYINNIKITINNINDLVSIIY